jgi:PAS domain S-box-containing protein
MSPAAAKRVVVLYALAVPALIAIGVVQHRIVQNLGAAQATVSRTGQTIQSLHAVGSSLRELEGELESSLNGSRTLNAQRITLQIAAVRSALEQVHLLSLNDEERMAKFSSLNSLVREQLEAAEKSLAESQRKPAAARPRNSNDTARSAKVEATLAEMTAGETARLKRQTEEAGRLATRTATTLGIGSIIAIWLVALAALLMHRQTVEKKWKGVERRVHTRILETLPVGVCMMDAAGFVLYTNRALDAMTGLKPEESVGRYFSNLHTHPREERDRLIEEITQRLQFGAMWEGEFVALRKGGKLYRCVARAVAAEIGDKPHWLFLQEDLGRVEPPRA